MTSSSWKKLRENLLVKGRPSARNGSLPCSNKTRSLESGITDMPSEEAYRNINLASEYLQNIDMKKMFCVSFPSLHK